MEDILKRLRKTKSYNKLYDVPWRTIMDRKTPVPKKLNGKLQIALVCHPCYGFGDIIFAIKMAKFIKLWYDIDCTIITTNPVPFLKNGITKGLYCLRKPNSSYEECSNLKYMKIYNIDKSGKPTNRANIKYKFDLIMVTPWIGTDYKPDKNVIRNFIPYANKFNTFLFSEYNAPNPELYDFPTGIGKGLYGLLITRFKFQKTIAMKNPYIMVHLTSDDRVDVTRCFSNFVKLMCKKYHKRYNKLDIIIPNHILSDTAGLDRLFAHIKRSGYYENIVIQTKPSSKKTLPNTLTLRADLGPLPYDKYTGLFKNCLPDVLITGDQSVTDIISCCKDYNIYYQIMPWKTNFARNLANELGKDFIGKASTSCGLEKFSVRTKLNLKALSKAQSFETIGKPKLDAILTFALQLRKNKDLQDFVEIVLSSRKKQTVIQKLK